MNKKSIFSYFTSIFSKNKLPEVKIDNPRMFYTSKIKPFIRSTGANIYRTYFYSKITNVLNLGFKFQKNIWKLIEKLHLKTKHNKNYTSLTPTDYKYDKTHAITYKDDDKNKKSSFSVKDALNKLKKAGII